MKKYLFIDIRKSDEVYNRRFEKSSDYEVYNIPMNMVRFNVDMIKKHLEYFDEIYIVCYSSSRSRFIKEKYFSDEPKIKVSKNIQFENLKNGDNNVKFLNDTDGPVTELNVIVKQTSTFNLYNMMRIIQLVLGSLIILLGGYTYFQIRNSKGVNAVPLMVLLGFGLMAVYNGLTSTCTISMLLRDYLN